MVRVKDRGAAGVVTGIPNSWGAVMLTVKPTSHSLYSFKRAPPIRIREATRKMQNKCPGRSERRGRFGGCSWSSFSGFGSGGHVTFVDSQTSRQNQSEWN